MNNNRRKELNKIHDHLIVLKESLQRINNDEQFAFDNLSEGLQQTERGQMSEEAIESMDSAIDNIDDAISNLEDIIL